MNINYYEYIGCDNIGDSHIKIVKIIKKYLIDNFKNLDLQKKFEYFYEFDFFKTLCPEYKEYEDVCKFDKDVEKITIKALNNSMSLYIDIQNEIPMLVTFIQKLFKINDLEFKEVVIQGLKLQICEKTLKIILT